MDDKRAEFDEYRQAVSIAQIAGLATVLFIALMAVNYMQGDYIQAIGLSFSAASTLFGSLYFVLYSRVKRTADMRIELARKNATQARESKRERVTAVVRALADQKHLVKASGIRIEELENALAEIQHEADSTGSVSADRMRTLTLGVSVDGERRV